MRKYFIRCFVLHLTICTIYFFVTDLEFVVTKQPDPVGIGLQQLICTVLQLMITIGYFMFLPWNAANRRQNNARIFTNIGAIVLAVAILASIDSALGNTLWSLHDHYNGYPGLRK
jgi:heme/copper-type cytochrome/quinol oxidase subunit 4